MIPDKIYIDEYSEGIYGTEWHTYSGSSGGTIAREYIRKDALKEWAKQQQLDSLTIVADNFWQEVIDKINSL